jgi:ATP-dependent Clp protease ATP-binding subunit ClpA
LRRALADELLFGKLVDGGSVLVDVDADGKVTLDFDVKDTKPSGAAKGSDQEAELVL